LIFFVARVQGPAGIAADGPDDRRLQAQLLAIDMNLDRPHFAGDELAFMHELCASLGSS
jgi:hypothetical protein